MVNGKFNRIEYLTDPNPGCVPNTHFIGPLGSIVPKFNETPIDLLQPGDVNDLDRDDQTDLIRSCTCVKEYMLKYLV